MHSYIVVKAKVRVTASGTINAGDKVVSAANGKAQSLAAVTAASIETVWLRRRHKGCSGN